MKNILELEKPHSDYVLDPAQLLNISASLSIVVKDIADKLERQLPGWLWTINPDEFAGMIYIYSLRLSGEFGWKMKIADIENDPDRKEAMRAGGEILERYGIRRGKYKRSLLQGKMQDLRGNYIPDLTDKAARTQKQNRDRIVTKAVAEGAIKFKTHDKVLEDGSTHREIFMQVGGDDEDAA